MAIDVKTRDPDRQQTLVCVMDGEQKLWDLQREWLGRSVEILDLFHALERVREVSKVVRPNRQIAAGGVGQRPAARLTDRQS